MRPSRHRRRTCCALLAGVWLSGAAAAAAPRAQPDVVAIREATSRSPEVGERWFSARSLSHFLLAMLARERGDLDGVLGELRLSALYETQSPYPRFALAEELARRGDFAAADAEAREALELDRAHAPSLMLLGRLESARGRHERAVDTLRRAARANPEDPEPLALLMQAHLARRELEQAVQVVERLDALVAGARDPSRKATRTAAQALAELADALAADGHDEQAEAYYRRAAARDGANGQRLVALGAFLEARGRAHEAALAYGRAFAPAGNDPQLAATAGRLYLKAGERGAAAAYIELIARTRDAASRRADDALLSLGYAFLAEEAFDEARRAFEAAREVAPERAEAYHALGTAWEAQGRFDRAEGAYAKVPSGDALGLSARVHGAWCAHRRGATAQAESALQELRLEHPQSAQVALALAAVLVDVRHLGEAAQVLARAMREAASPAVAVASARLSRRLGQAEEGVATLATARERWAEDEGLAQAEAELLASAGHREAAVARARAIVARRPSWAQALDLLASQLCDEAATLPEAESLARRALVEKPETPAYLGTLGRILVAEGQADAGLLLLERAAKAEPADAHLAAELAAARAATGRTAEARKGFERALALAKAHGDAEVQLRASRALEGLGRAREAP